MGRREVASRSGSGSGSGSGAARGTGVGGSGSSSQYLAGRQIHRPGRPLARTGTGLGSLGTIYASKHRIEWCQRIKRSVGLFCLNPNLFNFCCSTARGCLLQALLASRTFAQQEMARKPHGGDERGLLRATSLAAQKCIPRAEKSLRLLERTENPWGDLEVIRQGALKALRQLDACRKRVDRPRDSHEAFPGSDTFGDVAECWVQVMWSCLGNPDVLE
ncbi:hypothetical protein K438DRAFT_1790266 [Mycena galopus ATCC 62051]|nr:hypothetical protein K438DRAFT_1790266 [Mycena galopus ATCC 62051]